MDYVQITEPQRQAMLEAVGVDAIDALFSAIHPDHRLDRPLDLPPALSELELQRELASLTAANRTADSAACFMGAGAYDHFIPATVNDIAGRGEFVTAYTPYQAEASQGALQAFFEFQTQVARLTGLDVANASLYEGANSVTEAVNMALGVTGKRRILIAATLHPHYRQVLATSCSDLPCELIELPADPATGTIARATVEKHLDNDTACVVVQSPNMLGLIEDSADLFEATHTADKTMAIAVFNPIACALLKTPGDCGADIAAGEGQPLGIPLQYGGPYVGLFATRQKYVRKMPGRLIGQTVDAAGRRGYCLTLQTREQHIRGAKATSNICTNQGLLAIRATVYLSTMGPAGLRQVAEQCWHKAHYAASEIVKLDGYALPFDGPFFNEFAIDCPVDAARVIDAGRQRHIAPGVSCERLGIGPANRLLMAVTEKRTRQEIDGLVALLKEVA
jgi:glycine dehydrogenase subunit 1